MFIIRFLVSVLNTSFLIHLSDDLNFDTIEPKTKEKSYRIALLHLNLGDRQLYLITFNLKTRFNVLYILNFEDCCKSNISDNKNKTIKSQKQILEFELPSNLKEERQKLLKANDDKAKSLADFFKEKLSQEFTRINYSMTKLTSYRTFLLFLVSVGLPLFKFYEKELSFNAALIIFSVYYYYCFSLYKLISSAISVKNTEMATSSDFDWNTCNVALAKSYIHDLVTTRVNANKKVSLVKNAEKQLKKTFYLMLFLVLSLLFISNNSLEKTLVPPSNNASFIVYNNNGDFILSNFSSLVSQLERYGGDIYIMYCDGTVTKKKLIDIFRILEVDSKRIKFIETNNSSFCNGLTIIHF